MIEYKKIITGTLMRTMDEMICLTGADPKKISQDLFKFLEKLYLNELASKATRLSFDDYLRKELAYVEPAIQHLIQLLASISSCEHWQIELLFVWTVNDSLEYFLRETSSCPTLRDKIEYWIIYRHLIKTFENLA